jgi:hypothetical protein
MRIFVINLDTKTLEECPTKERPTYRSYFSVSLIPNTKRAILFGGMNESGQALDEVYIVNLGKDNYRLIFGSLNLV